MADGLRLALTTLTVLPVRGPAQVDRATAGRAMSLAPVVGLLLGALAAVVVAGATALSTSLLAAALGVGLLAGLTRGLHLDGLADTTDGLASYRPAEQALQIMKRPDAGPLGLAAVVLSLLLQTSALAACTAAGRGPAAVVLATVTARTAVALACTPATPAASATGLGATVAGTVPVRTGRLLLGTLLVVAVGLSALDGAVAAVRAGLAVGLALLAARLVRRHAVRRLGGVTGDVLGALVEVTASVALVVLALG